MGELFPDRAEQVVLNRQHSECPEVGDYWSEMFMPTAIVVMVDAEWVCVQRDFKGNAFTFGIDPKPHVMSRRAFRKWLRYDSIPDKTWCEVAPRCFARGQVAADEVEGQVRSAAKSVPPRSAAEEGTQ